MKRILTMIALAVLSVGLLGSCTKNIEERLDKTDASVAELKAAIGQYEKLQSDINAVIQTLRAEVGNRPASEQKAIWDCINALQNQKGTFEVAIAALQELVGDDAVSVQIDEAVAELISEYHLDSLAADIQAIRDKLNEKSGISALADEVSQLQKRAESIARILSVIGTYEDMIQSVRINPAYADGSVKAELETLSFTFTVTPAEAISGVKNLAKCLKLYADEVEVKTKAGAFAEIPVTKAEIVDKAKGEVRVEADITKFLPKEKTEALSIALNVKTGVSNYTTEFVTVTSVDYVVMKMGADQSRTLKWKMLNLGARTIAGSFETCAGDYYQWGSVNTIYESIPWNEWPWTGDKTLTSWKSGKEEGFVDANREYTSSPATLPDTKDVIKQKIGGGWRMPTKQEFSDLADACGGKGSYDKTTDPGKDTPVEKGIYWCTNYGGVAGVLFCDGTNKLFFPAAGCGQDTQLCDVGTYCYNWAKDCNNSNPYASLAYDLCFAKGVFEPGTSASYRSKGYPVRPVAM